jgi:hypothetical protein
MGIALFGLLLLPSYYGRLAMVVVFYRSKINKNSFLHIGISMVCQIRLTT